MGQKAAKTWGMTPRELDPVGSWPGGAPGLILAKSHSLQHQEGWPGGQQLSLSWGAAKGRKPCNTAQPWEA